ncbi:hypothetical protein MSAN_00593700 [Mycena sanguinolenta]|uniref:DUF6534 domain-containing protein n=1 Tax=Mycena sanguinolenta TaxID=230812 RepID=A0A8H6ZDU3_9AGAR|nr:hypothetical protein MSAN_00593700 [Mycena sanguinolenta]
MAQYDDLLGPILISSWLTAILYGVTISKAWEYVVVYPKTLRFRKGLLLSCIVTSSLALIAEFANVYYPTVTFWGECNLETQMPFENCIGLCRSTLYATVSPALWLTAFSSIAFIDCMSGNIWIALFLVLFVSLALAGSIYVGVIVATVDEISRDRAAAAALVWTIGTAGSDIFITFAFIWELYTMRTAFISTDSLIWRLAVGAIQTGSTTSMTSVATLVSAYISKDGSTAPTAFHYLIGPLYLLTLLYNFTLQPHDRISKSGTSGVADAATPNFCMDGIHVHRTEVISTELISTRRPTVISRIYCDKRPNEVAADRSYSSHLTA